MARILVAVDELHRIRTVVLDESVALRAYRRLADEITDPTGGVVLGLLAHDVEQDRTLLQRIVAGALDALTPPCPQAARHTTGSADAVREIQALKHASRMRAQQLSDLACSERGLDRAPLAMLLDAMASNADKHALLLEELGGYLEDTERATPSVSLPTTKPD